jgi:hypothetical protein
LEKNSVCRNFRHTAVDEKTYDTATSIDYTPNDVLTKKFFATVQNKMNYAVHGQAAAELIKSRADSSKPFILKPSKTSSAGTSPKE